jgi:hypothetical protein
METSSSAGCELTAGLTFLTDTLKGLIGVAAIAVCGRLAVVGGELPTALTGDSKTCDAE